MNARAESRTSKSSYLMEACVTVASAPIRICSLRAGPSFKHSLVVSANGRYSTDLIFFEPFVSDHFIRRFESSILFKKASIALDLWPESRCL